MGFKITDLNPYAAAADSITNPLFSHLTNVANRKFTREMYGRQRADALADWTMNNEYNSPRAQMQRFQEAGLNPNLIYGQMTEAAPVRSSSSSGGEAQAPRTEFSRNMLMAADVEQRKAQSDLTAQMLEVEKEKVKNTQADTMLKIMNTDLTEAQKENLLFDLGLKKDLRDTNVEFRQWELIDLKTKQNEVQQRVMQAAQENPLKVKKMLQDLATALIQNAKTEDERKEIQRRTQILEQEFNRNKMWQDRNIDHKDPALIRWLLRITRAFVTGSD